MAFCRKREIKMLIGKWSARAAVNLHYDTPRTQPYRRLQHHFQARSMFRGFAMAKLLGTAAFLMGSRNYVALDAAFHFFAAATPIIESQAMFHWLDQYYDGDASMQWGGDELPVSGRVRRSA
jgi:hypothetical protein